MTQVVKQFISMNDVTSLRIECNYCKASLTLPIQAITFTVPEVCPACKGDWYEGYGSGPTLGKAISSYVGELKKLRRFLEDKSPAASGFTLDVEVTGLSAVRVSSSPDA